MYQLRHVDLKVLFELKAKRVFAFCINQALFSLLVGCGRERRGKERKGNRGITFLFPLNVLLISLFGFSTQKRTSSYLFEVLMR